MKPDDRKVREALMQLYQATVIVRDKYRLPEGVRRASAKVKRVLSGK